MEKSSATKSKNSTGKSLVLKHKVLGKLQNSSGKQAVQSSPNIPVTPSISRVMDQTDRSTSGSWRTSLWEVVEGNPPISTRNGTSPNKIITCVEPPLPREEPQILNSLDNSKALHISDPEPIKTQVKEKMIFPNLVEKIQTVQLSLSPGRMSLDGQCFQHKELPTVSVEETKIFQDKTALSVANHCPPLLPRGEPPRTVAILEGQGHPDLLREELPKKSDMTNAVPDSEHYDVSLSETHDFLDLKDVDISSIVTDDFDIAGLEACTDDKSELEDLLASLSPIKSPQKICPPIRSTLTPKKQTFQVPGGDVQAVSISQLPVDFKNRMKDVVTCKTSTGSTTCLIRLTHPPPKNQLVKSPQIQTSPSDTNISLTKLKLREMLKERQLTGGPPPISSTFVPLVTTGLSRSKYARRIAQMEKDNESILSSMSSTGGDI